MAIDAPRHSSPRHRERVRSDHLPDHLADSVLCAAPEHESPPAPRLRCDAHVTSAAIARRWSELPARAATAAQAELADARTLATAEVYQGHIENFIGTVSVPVGVAGPLRRATRG